jgi:hypothetical protein
VAAARKLVPDEELEDTHPRVDVVDVQICALERNLLVHTLVMVVVVQPM